MMVNNIFWLVVEPYPTPLKNDGVRQLGCDYSQLNGKIKNVPNHQPVVDLPIKNGDVQTNYVILPEDTVFGTWLSGLLLHFLGVSSPSVGPDVLGEQSYHGKPLIPCEKD